MSFFFLVFPGFCGVRSGVFASGAASVKVFEETWELQTVEYIDIKIIGKLYGIILKRIEPSLRPSPLQLTLSICLDMIKHIAPGY